MSFSQEPHFEGYDENVANLDAELSSKMKKKLKMLATFAKNEYLCTR